MTKSTFVFILCLQRPYLVGGYIYLPRICTGPHFLSFIIWIARAEVQSNSDHYPTRTPKQRFLSTMVYANRLRACSRTCIAWMNSRAPTSERSIWQYHVPERRRDPAPGAARPKCGIFSLPQPSPGGWHWARPNAFCHPKMGWERMKTRNIKTTFTAAMLSLVMVGFVLSGMPNYACATAAQPCESSAQCVLYNLHL
jgi:hypothetical protein